MEYIKINEKTYGYAVDFRDNDTLRYSFNSLTRRIFGFDFEAWYQSGYWKDRYIPYALLDDNKVISNISVNVIDFFVMEEKKRYIQIGTVMTDEQYRNQGLSKFLMNKILDEWKDKCDLIYLFANDSVFNFYPKFSFVAASEYQYSKKISLKKSTSQFVKLNMSEEKDRNFVVNTINKSIKLSQLCMYDNASLVMFYCTSFMKQNVYYIKTLDTVTIASYDVDTLYLYDVFSLKQDVSLDDIIISMSNKDVKKVVMGFTPKDTSSFDVKILKEDDTTLFILKDNLDTFNNKKIMFPVLSHA